MSWSLREILIKNRSSSYEKHFDCSRATKDTIPGNYRIYGIRCKKHPNKPFDISSSGFIYKGRAKCPVCNESLDTTQPKKRSFLKKVSGSVHQFQKVEETDYKPILAKIAEFIIEKN